MDWLIEIFCKFWWLLWLLPFLLGLLLGALLWRHWRKKFSSLERDYDKCTKDTSRIEQENANLKSDLELAIDKKRKLENDYKNLKVQLDAKNLDTSASASTSLGLESDLKLAESTNLELESGNNQLKADLNLVKARLNQSETNEGQLKADLNNAMIALRRLENENDQLKANLNVSSLMAGSTSGVVSSSQSDVGELEQELELCRKRRIELENQLNTLAKNESSQSNMNLGTKADSSSKSTGIAADKFAALKEDNLQVVEGIGPKMNEILTSHGVKTWAQLAAKSPDELKGILNTYGDKYRIIDPATWAEQAAYARDRQWDSLINYQKSLSAGKNTDSQKETDSKVEKIMIKLGILKRWKQDDLKAVEGIGPKIEGLLHLAGIKTWLELSNTSVSEIKDILEKAGDRFKLAVPDTWPKQAKMAAEGRFDELDKYQEELNGGRE